MKKTVIQGLLLALAVTASSFSWASKKPESPKSGGTQIVDAGAFGVYRQGRRMATETFRIEQMSDGSQTTSEIKLEDGSSRKIRAGTGHRHSRRRDPDGTHC